MPSKKSNEITKSDFECLKDLLTKSSKSWTQKLLVPLLIGNISLLSTIVWSAVSDHFLIKDLATTAQAHSKQLVTLTEQLIKDENILIRHDEKIKQLEGNHATRK